MQPLNLPPFRSLVPVLVVAALAGACRDADVLSPVDADLQLASAAGADRCALQFSDDEVRAEIAGLLAEVRALAAVGTLNNGRARALTNHLETAGGHLDADRYCPVRAQLGSFRQQVEGFLGAGVLEEGQARPMIRVINRLLNDRPPEVIIDPAVVPVTAQIAGINGGPSRPLARFVNADGRVVDFVANELYLMTDDAAELDAFVARWSGTVILTMDFTTIGVTTTPPVYLVRIDPTGADVDGLPERWARSAGLNGVNQVSSEAGAQLLAAALQEVADRGLKVGVNFLLESAEYRDRTASDAAAAAGAAPDGTPYTSDPYTWPYMNRGSAQDIGTAEAWRVMDAMGRFDNRVSIGVADGGFRPNADFPDTQRMIGALRTANPDPGNCGSDGPASPSCTWHGTHVVLSGMGKADNSFGGAGPAGPVADVVMLQSPSPDFVAYMGYILDHIPSALDGGQRIVNISASTGLPSEWCLLAIAGLPICETLHGITVAFRTAGILVVAAAGNQGADVDQTKVFGVWPVEFTEESDLVIPCELSTVLCVGGLRWNASTKHGSSNWGSAPSSLNTVRMYAPFEVWSVADAVAADETAASPDSRAGIVSGTSFAAPYVAGVAALVWAANPGLTATQVESILLSTAHTGSADSRVPRWINALGSVQRAVGGNTPPYVRITGPAEGSRHPRGRVMVTLSALVEDLEDDAVVTTWTSDLDGVLGTGQEIRRNDLSFGTHTITATASDGRLSTTSRSIQIEIFNELASITIDTPSELDNTFCVGQVIPLAATVVDHNNPPTFTVPEEQITWHVGSPTRNPPFATGSTTSISFDATGSYQLFVHVVDGGGRVSQNARWVTINNDCDGLPPTATIVEPAGDTPRSHPDWAFDGFDDSRGMWYKDVALSGRGSDAEDGTLIGDALRWSVRTGEHSWTPLGTGEDLAVRLYSDTCGGEWKTIRLVARDSDGNESAHVIRRIHIWSLC